MKKKKPSTGTLLARYRDPLKPGSLGGLKGVWARWRTVRTCIRRSVFSAAGIVII